MSCLNKIDVSERFKFETSQYNLLPIEEYLKFFSIFNDEEAVKQGIINKENAKLMPYFAALILRDKDLYSLLHYEIWIEGAFDFMIIGSLLELNCFEDGVNRRQLAKYICSRWRFSKDYDESSIALYLAPSFRIKYISEYVRYHWLVAKHISYYNPLQRRFTKKDEISL
jgi:hypothetical protein